MRTRFVLQYSSRLEKVRTPEKRSAFAASRATPRTACRRISRKHATHGSRRDTAAVVDQSLPTQHGQTQAVRPYPQRGLSKHIVAKPPQKNALSAFLVTRHADSEALAWAKFCVDWPFASLWPISIMSLPGLRQTRQLRAKVAREGQISYCTFKAFVCRCRYCSLLPTAARTTCTSGNNVCPLAHSPVTEQTTETTHHLRNTNLNLCKN